MDFKAVISNCGNEKVYKELSSEVERRLPTAPVEWKRSYGRASKEVILQACFSKFDSTQLTENSKVESFAKLTSKPLLHLFWTSCTDNDKYKSAIKSQVTNWQKHLSKYKDVDWLVVHVMYQENSKSGKSKIQLPRSSVYDKLKSDFGQDRCVQLWEPDKETLFTKSGESWETLLFQLRSLLLESFGRYLDKFEEKIRSMREKYANPDWPFIDYFLVHEELAFIYQSITLNEDALIQYDEVDALLSQFIINSSGKEFPKWLSELSSQPENWDGVLLSSKVADQYNTLIQSKKATLLDLRNYIFLRQCKLLIKMKRKWEIPSRLLEFLFAVVHEFRLLDMKIPEQVVACWIVLTCLQVLPVLEKVDNTDQNFRATIAQTYDLMRQKVHLLGQITGVYYHRDQTKEEKEIVKKLCAGIGVLVLNKNTSPKVVEAALESKEKYEKLYVDITNECISKYDQIGRKHFKMFVGIDLAKFYLQHGLYLAAEPLLETSWSIYKSQRWETLYSDVLIPLADCQLKHKVHERYLNSVTLLSCAHCLLFDTRDFYSKEVLRLSQDNELTFPTLSCEPCLKIVSVKVALVKMKGHIGDKVQVNIVLDNELTVPLTCNQVSINVKHFDLSNPDSFSENVLSARKSLFENRDYGMNSVSPSNNDNDKELSKEDTTKEAFTPSNLLKRIKSHRRTWSRNKNVVENVENKENEISNVSTAATDGGLVRSSGSTSEEVSTEINNAKRALFESGDSSTTTNTSTPSNGKKTSRDESKLVNGDATNVFKDKTLVEGNESNGGTPKRSSILELARKSSSSSFTSISQDDVVDSTTETSSETRRFANKGSSEEKNNKNDLSLDLSQLGEENLSTPKRAADTTEATTELPEDIEYDVLLKIDEPFVLQPGRNQVQVTETINHEGKYTMQCVNCYIGNLHLYKKLVSRKEASFYMVTEPPRVTWTTNYLVDYALTGTKQRIHVTVMNGPGAIRQGSVLRISSETGLAFYSLAPSDIEIFPLERDGKSRQGTISVSVVGVDGEEGRNEAWLTLPDCKPYERVNVFFDVMAPIHQDLATNTCQQELLFVCQWLKDLSETLQRLHLIFYEPFQMKHEVVTTSSMALVKVTIRGLNPVYLSFSNASLSLNDGEREALEMFKTGPVDSWEIYNNEEVVLLWKVPLDRVKDLLNNENKLQCYFSIDFKTKNTQHLEHFEKPLIFSFSKCLYSVSVELTTDNPTKGLPCTARALIKSLEALPGDNNKKIVANSKGNKRLCMKLDPREHFWRITSQVAELLSPSNGDDTTTPTAEWSCDVELVCDASGIVNSPLFALCSVEEVQKSAETGLTEVVTPLTRDEVDYLSNGKMVFVVEEPRLETDV